MPKKWIIVLCILVALVSAGITMTNARESARLREMLREQKAQNEQLLVDADRERKTWDALYRSCRSENSTLKEQLKGCL